MVVGQRSINMLRERRFEDDVEFRLDPILR